MLSGVVCLQKRIWVNYKLDYRCTESNKNDSYLKPSSSLFSVQYGVQLDLHPRVVCLSVYWWLNGWMRQEEDHNSYAVIITVKLISSQGDQPLAADGEEVELIGTFTHHVLISKCCPLILTIYSSQRQQLLKCLPCIKLIVTDQARASEKSKISISVVIWRKGDENCHRLQHLQLYF